MALFSVSSATADWSKVHPSASAAIPVFRTGDGQTQADIDRIAIWRRTMATMMTLMAMMDEKCVITNRFIFNDYFCIFSIKPQLAISGVLKGDVAASAGGLRSVEFWGLCNACWRRWLWCFRFDMLGRKLLLIPITSKIV